MLYLCCGKGLVITTISKVVNKFISTCIVHMYVTIMAGTDVAKAKYKAVRNRAFSVMRMTRGNEKILVLVSRFSIKVSFY